MRSKQENTANNERGFSIFELLISTTIMLVLLGMVSLLISKSVGSREMEGRKTDALTSAHAALNVMSREIANSGFGLTTNGIIAGDSNASRLHFRSNIENEDSETKQTGEDVTYFHDAATNSVVRYDPNDSPKTSPVIHDVSKVKFEYFGYSGSSSTPIAQGGTPDGNTGRVRITVTVLLANVQGQPRGQTVEFTSDVTIRNSQYMLNQY